MSSTHIRHERKIRPPFEAVGLRKLSQKKSQGLTSGFTFVEVLRLTRSVSACHPEKVAVNAHCATRPEGNVRYLNLTNGNDMRPESSCAPCTNGSRTWRLNSKRIGQFARSRHGLLKTKARARIPDCSRMTLRTAFHRRAFPQSRRMMSATT